MKLMSVRATTISADSLRGRLAAAVLHRPHPHTYRPGVFEDSDASRKSDEAVAGNAYRSPAIKGSPAGPCDGFIDQVAVICGPFFKNVDRVFEAGDLPNKVLSVLDENRWVEQTIAHRFLQKFQRFDNAKNASAPLRGRADEGKYWLGRGGFQQLPSDERRVA